MEIERGIKSIEPTLVESVIEAAKEAGLPLFILTTGSGRDREAFFDAVRASLPLDPPLQSSRSWEALSDSVWEGMRQLDSGGAVILWPDATAFRDHALSEYNMGIQVLSELTQSLANTATTAGHPKEVSIFVAVAAGTSGGVGDD